MGCEADGSNHAQTPVKSVRLTPHAKVHPILPIVDAALFAVR